MCIFCITIKCIQWDVYTYIFALQIGKVGEGFKNSRVRHGQSVKEIPGGRCFVNLYMKSMKFNKNFWILLFFCFSCGYKNTWRNYKGYFNRLSSFTSGVD